MIEPRFLSLSNLKSEVSGYQVAKSSKAKILCLDKSACSLNESNAFEVQLCANYEFGNM